MAHPMNTTCDQCNETVRKDTYIVHIIKNHPTFFWDDIFSLVCCQETGAMELKDRSKMQLREAYNVLDSGSSYELEHEVYVDFGSKQTFKNSETALKHIQKNTEKHKQKYVDMLKEGLNVDNVKQLITFLRQRKVKVIDDASEIKRQVERQLAEEKLKYAREMNEMREYTDKCKKFMERDEVKQIETMEQIISRLRKELADATNVMRHQDAELYGYRTSYANLESVNKTNMINEMNQMSYYEKAKANCEAKMKKHEEDCDKKIKKAKEEIVELTEKFDKKEKKLKSEIKAYKQEIQLVKLRAKQSDSDSESD
jgi:DNA repair exonuclease SbcCD ATPase subunit